MIRPNLKDRVELLLCRMVMGAAVWGLRLRQLATQAAR
jgi:hypothetical protein